MAKSNTIQFYRGPGVPGEGLSAGELAIDTTNTVLLTSPTGAGVKSLSMYKGSSAPSSEYQDQLWLDTSVSETGLPNAYAVANNLTTGSAGSYVLDAYQGKLLSQAISANSAAISNISDRPYIVEEGTNYRKWSDGKAECWGKQDFDNYTLTSTSGEYRSEVLYITYPITFKDTTDMVAVIGSGYTAKFPTKSAYSTSQCGFRINSPNSTIVSVEIEFTVHGYWK